MHTIRCKNRIWRTDIPSLFMAAWIARDWCRQTRDIVTVWRNDTVVGAFMYDPNAQRVRWWNL